MKTDTTILIETKNNESFIIRTLKKIDDLTNKHKNLQGIFLDQHSKDETPNIIINYLKNNHNSRMTFLTPIKGTTKKRAYQELIKKQIQTNNLVTIEPELCHETRNIPYLIKKLNKANVIIPNRLDNRSNLIGTIKQKKEFIKKASITKRKFKKIKDPTQTHFAIKTTTLRKHLNKKVYNWTQLFQKLDSENKISQPPTKYNLKRRNKTKNS